MKELRAEQTQAPPSQDPGMGAHEAHHIQPPSRKRRSRASQSLPPSSMAKNLSEWPPGPLASCQATAPSRLPARWEAFPSALHLPGPSKVLDLGRLRGGVGRERRRSGSGTVLLPGWTPQRKRMSQFVRDAPLARESTTRAVPRRVGRTFAVDISGPSHRPSQAASRPGQ